MPYKFIPSSRPPVDENLVDRIAQELRLQRPDGPETAPTIIEEETQQGGYRHVTVIWDEWKELSKQDRSRMIMEAYRRARGTDSLLSVSVALGLTGTEADRLGIMH